MIAQSGADLGLQDMWGNTPLHWGSRNGYEMVVRELLAAKADTQIQNHKKNTPIDDARSNRNVACHTILQLASLRASKWTLVRRHVKRAFEKEDHPNNQMMNGEI